MLLLSFVSITNDAHFFIFWTLFVNAVVIVVDETELGAMV